LKKRVGWKERIMQHIAVIGQGGVMAYQAPILRRFAAKLVVDVVPAAIASLLVGYLMTHFGFGYAASPPAVTAPAAPASMEMMQLVRDEHAAIMGYLEAQQAAEKRRYTAEDDADARAAADAKAVATSIARSIASATVVSQPVVARNKVPAPTVAVAVPPRVPLVIAQAIPTDGGAAAAVTPKEPDSLLAKAVHATLHAVSVIGGIPNWVASLGDRSGGGDTASPPAGAMQRSASS
jgi:hypothetical protein